MLHVVVGGQFGSEAKGAVTAAICADAAADELGVVVVRVGGPNAGHTAYDPAGRKWALRQVPAGMVVDPSVVGVIADGSEVDLEVLDDEITGLERAGHSIRGRLWLSGEATVVEEAHKARERELVGAIGSTGKGIGAARADRVMRTAKRVSDLVGTIEGLALPKRVAIWPAGTIGPVLTKHAADREFAVVVEGVQGFGLGLHAGYYPQCTSSNVRAIDAVAAAGINPWGLTPGLDLEVHLVVRPYPIRVAGNSGPLLGETTWAELGLEPERTTVTQKIRRVGEWDPELVRAAVAANGPGTTLSVSMVDQVPGAIEEVEGELQLTATGRQFLHGVEAEIGRPVVRYGMGPRVQDWKVFV